MAFVIEKPEDHLKLQIGDLVFSNTFLKAENERLAKELEQAKKSQDDVNQEPDNAQVRSAT